jgi:hypothetical protein
VFDSFANKALWFHPLSPWIPSHISKSCMNTKKKHARNLPELFISTLSLSLSALEVDQVNALMNKLKDQADE